MYLASGQALLFYLFYYCNKWSYLLIILLLVLLFLVLKIILPLLSLIKEKDWDSHKFNIIKNELKFVATYVLVILFICFFTGILLNWESSLPSPQKIFINSNLLLEYDRNIFGSDVLFPLNNYVNSIGGEPLGWIFLQFYNSLPFIIVALIFILLLFEKTLAKKFIMFFLIILLISMPMWYFFPGLNPINFYINNLLKVDLPSKISSELKNYSPNAVLISYQKSFSYDYKPKDFIDITTFPSMHAAFSVGVIIFAYLLWPPSIFITLPWFVLEMVGALYTGQHYVFDLLIGSIVALLAYYLVLLIERLSIVKKFVKM